MNVTSFNCQGFKSNRQMVRNLVDNNDILFLIEHWLTEDQYYLLDEISSSHDIVNFQADMDVSSCSLSRRGRPFGGKCWFIRNEIKIVSNDIINKHISTIEIKVNLNGNNEHMLIIGGWLPFDDGSSDKLASFKSSLSAIAAAIHSHRLRSISSPILIIGDFNAAISRGRRFDLLFEEFIAYNNLIDGISEYVQELDYTWSNGNNTAILDHILVNHSTNEGLLRCTIEDSNMNLSDHRPVCATVEYICDPAAESPIPTANRKFHKFEWNDEEFVNSFKYNLRELLVPLAKDHCRAEISRTDQISSINHIFKELPRILLRAARQSEKVVQCPNPRSKRINKNNPNLDPAIRAAFEQAEIWHQLYKDTGDTNMRDQWQQYKRELRTAQRVEIFVVERVKAFNLDSFYNSNRMAFWRRIARFKKRKRKSFDKDPVDVEAFGSFYRDLFSHRDRASTVEQQNIRSHVEAHYLSLQDMEPDSMFTDSEVKFAIDDLSLNKACGIDYVSAEMLRYGDIHELTVVLRHMFNTIVSTGHVPDDFNISVVTPIPKKGEQHTPGDFRPISVSSVFANIFERLLLSKMDRVVTGISNNQFGYRHRTSCKHAYFAVNETIAFYRKGGSKVHVVSLDASKAFDKLWRDGLFFKLKDIIPSVVWRALYVYYSKSQIVVSYNNKRTSTIRTEEGVKQGGILSPFLFNFYINKLIENCLQMRVGASVGDINTSIVAYCDDIVLISPTSTHIDQLLNASAQYAAEWKLEFNSKKSEALTLFSKIHYQFKLNGVDIPNVDHLVYLGLPIGNQNFVDVFFSKKFNKVERSMYSLREIGCKPLQLSPIRTAYIYKQYCQSQLNYGLETVHLTAKCLKELNNRQNLLVKYAIGISKYSRTSPLFDSLYIEQIEVLYRKHKILFYKQLSHNPITSSLFDFLCRYYSNSKIPQQSYFAQLGLVEKCVNIRPHRDNKQEMIDAVKLKFSCADLDLVESIRGLFHEMSAALSLAELVSLLEQVKARLYVDFYNDNINNDITVLDT